MRVGIMQPYFFPYPGHFALISRCEDWYVFDLTQYTPKSWINRNRVLHPGGGPNWISVPLANSSIHIRIADARVQDVAGTARAMLGKLSHYRKRAPHCRAVEAIVAETFALPSGDESLVHLNLRGLTAVCQYLGLPFRPRICSELDLDLPAACGAGDWALEIASRVGATAYLNPISGRGLFDPSRFAARGIELQFVDPQPWHYAQGTGPAVPGLSILDALMWNDAASVAAAIRAAAVVVAAGPAQGSAAADGPPVVSRCVACT